MHELLHAPAPARRRTATRSLTILGVLAAAVAWSWPSAAYAWGDEGHEIVGHIAARYLSPAASRAIDALLVTDTSGLTAQRSLAAETTWADHYRDSDRDGERRRYRATQAWHYVDVEIAAPDLDAACHGHPSLPPGVPASQGPPTDCIVDKIEQFTDELADPETSPSERLRALQFLLHLVGDLHQPLHAADHEDHGGNGVRVRGPGLRGGNLHHAWDTAFVEDFGHDPAVIAASFTADLTARTRRRYGAGTPRDWARDSFAVALAHVYGPLSPTTGDVLELDDAYVRQARDTVRVQLTKAGIRLARLLNDAFAAHPARAPHRPREPS